MVNEKRLIDAEALRHKINAFAASVVYRGNAEMFNGKDTCNPHEYTRGYERGVLDAQKIVCGQPTVDAVEVVHGWWLYSHTEAFAEECSQCGFCVPWDDGMLHEYNYCPNCGAKMDGEEKDSDLLFADMEEIIDATD